MTDPIDIGLGVKINFVENAQGVRCGLIESHTRPNGDECCGYVAFRHVPQDSKSSWVVEKEEPLTLSPSVLCKTCGHHGYISEGRWVPA